MINCDKFKEAGKKITWKLDEIRTKLGVEPADFSLSKVTVEDLGGYDLINRIKENPRGVITTKDGKLAIAYIKNHTNERYHSKYDESIGRHSNRCYVDGYKIHFHKCKTLDKMERYDRYNERYEVTNRLEDEQPIELPPKADRRSENARLPICKFCLGDMIKYNFEFPNTSENRNMLAEYGGINKLMCCVRLWSRDAPEFDNELKEFIQETKERCILLNKNKID